MAEPAKKPNWVAYAVGSHLNGNFDRAVEAVSQLEKIQEGVS